MDASGFLLYLTMYVPTTSHICTVNGELTVPLRSVGSSASAPVAPNRLNWGSALNGGSSVDGEEPCCQHSLRSTLFCYGSSGEAIFVPKVDVSQICTYTNTKYREAQRRSRQEKEHGIAFGRTSWYSMANHQPGDFYFIWLHIWNSCCVVKSLLDTRHFRWNAVHLHGVFLLHLLHML